ncbi:MAG: tetraacyldisaccharide 4'-kinase [Sedimenticola sp.]|nr:MAG: tetraacyldisaccharide 4'-kinase [Sedimenticola sp.]
MKRLDAYWVSLNPVSLLLLPLSLLFCSIAWLRRRLYRLGVLKRHSLPVPVLVVGNITVGGTGKTPLVIWLVEYLRQLGYRPGVVSRGYGGTAGYWPQQVQSDSDPALIGDEPALLARRTACPIRVGPNRVVAARTLLEQSDCNIIISDDGLQHYALGRDLEIVVIDGERRFGNGLCLPAGPLRERPGRLADADFVVINGATASAGQSAMSLQPYRFINLCNPEKQLESSAFAGQQIHAFAGIGHPGRFFDTLRALGVELVEHAFPDHHPFSAADFRQVESEIVLMTEKDAVKCASFAKPDYWYLTINAVLDEDFQQSLQQRLRGLNNG